ncbi:MAG: hypothetical protein M3R35_08100 [Candidatus Eremiobacteraeota bacterium]|nr:hypothetical protein [Candidatus Eremiobacteraeota bacterium]
MKFTTTANLPVRKPYRLDLTSDALRRLAANVVDYVDAEGTYQRALADDRGVNVVAVRQRGSDALDVRLSGRNAQRWMPVVERMLGTTVSLDGFYRRARTLPWLRRLSLELRGLKPPRYPDLWESLAHAIVFQQISIHAAASIMRRMVELLAEPVDGPSGARLFPFPRPRMLLAADVDLLRAAGLSANKIAHLREAAQAVTSGRLCDAVIEKMDTETAIEHLCAVRGIGRWSAAVVMLRGFGRLDVFPMNDSGVARSIKIVTGNPDVDVDSVLAALGPTRGMLYFHLLLGRLRKIVPEPAHL